MEYLFPTPPVKKPTLMLWESWRSEQRPRGLQRGPSMCTVLTSFYQVPGGCPGGGGVPGTGPIKLNLQQQGPVHAESPDEQTCYEMEYWAGSDPLISTIHPGHVLWF